MSSLHISINAEPIFTLAGVTVTNSMLTTWVVTAILLLFSARVFKEIQSVKFNTKPSRFQSFVELIVESLYNLVNSIAGSHKKSRVFLPMIATFFIFILVSNWFGLLPGVGTIGIREEAETSQVEERPESAIIDETIETEDTVDEHTTENATTTEETDKEEVLREEGDSEMVEETAQEDHLADEGESSSKFVPLFRGPTADLNTTLALAIVSMITVQAVGFQFMGFSYTKKFFNLKSPIDFFIGILELLSDISKIISFAFRLFGNIFAGEVLLAVMAFLLPAIAPLPFIGLEIFVGFVQALVFAMLSLVFMNMATQGHGEEH